MTIARIIRNSGTAQASAFDAAADFTARSASAFYANDASHYADDTALRNASYGGAGALAARVTLSTELGSAISGKAIRIAIPKDSSESTADFRHSFVGLDSQVKTTAKRRFFYQFGLVPPSYLLDHRFATVGDTADTSHKFAIIAEPDLSFTNADCSEILVTSRRFRRFVTAYRMLTAGVIGEFQVSIADIPGSGGNPDFRWQNAIDTGAAYSTNAEAKERFGPLNYSFTATNTYGGGTLTAQGNPEAASAINGIVWVPDVVNVVTVFADADANTVMMWHAVHGQAPRLVINFQGNADLGFGAGNYRGVQLLPRLEELVADATREDAHALYCEIIASDNPIDYPGGFPLPGLTPPWAAGVAAGFWATISTDTIADHDPEDDAGVNPNFPASAPWRGNSGQAFVVSGWSGGGYLASIGTSGTLIVWGGGHADYYGSELYSFDLYSMTWSRLSDPYTGTYSWPNTDGQWPGGIPGVPHTYQHFNADPDRGVLLTLRCQQNNTPNVLALPASFDPSAGTWTFGTQGPSGDLVSSDGCMAYDTTRQLWWTRGGQTGGDFGSYDAAADAWVTYTSKGTESGTMMAYDPVNDFLVMVAAHASVGQVLYGIDPANPNTARVTLTQSGRPTISTGMGVVYSTLRQAFIVWNDGENIYELKKGVGAWSVATWTWTNLVDGANTVAPTRNTNGTFTRLQLATYGADEYLILVNSTTGAVYAFKVPAP